MASQIAEILLKAGEDAAAARREQGAITGQMFQSLGQTVGSIPGQMVAAQSAQDQEQIRQAQLAAIQRQTAGRMALADAIKANTDPVKGPDHQKIASAVSAAGFPDQAESWLQTAASNAENLDKLRTSTESHQKMQRETIGDLAYTANTPEDFVSSLGLLAVTPGSGLDEQTAHQIADQIQGNPDAADQLRSKYLPFSPKYQAAQAKGKEPITVPRGAVVNTPERAAAGQAPLMQGQPEPVTQAQIAMQAAGGDPSTAMGLLKRPTAAPSLEEQLLQAITKGDTATADRITSTMTVSAKAKQDPAAVATAEQLRKLNVREAQARLDDLATKNAPLDIRPEVQTTLLAGGLPYLDTSKYQPAELPRARAAAEQAGIPIVSKDTAAGLEAADRASATLNTMWSQLKPFLPTDPQGRLLGGPKNSLEKIFQSNPTLGAYDSWRTAAIQSVQALAEKGMGLRLNANEIDAMMQGLPKLTDDAPTAAQKLANIQAQLTGKVKVALTGDRRNLTVSSAVTPPGSSTTAKTLTVDQVKQMATMANETYENAKKYAESQGYIVK